MKYRTLGKTGFRMKPIERFFPEALKNNVGILARVPLACGLFTGTLDRNSEFESNDHRFFNRNVERFDKGETFSGVDYLTGIEAVEELKKVFPATETLSAWALKWTLMFEAVSCVIPGASLPSQAVQNAMISDIPDLSPDQMKAVEGIYNRYIRKEVHHLW